MSKLNQDIQQLALEYWLKMQSTGLAYELTRDALVRACFRDGFKAGQWDKSGQRSAKILELTRENAALKAQLRSERQSVYDAKQVEIPILKREIALLKAARAAGVKALRLHKLNPHLWPKL